jgi:hypothetical protein
VQPAPL